MKQKQLKLFQQMRYYFKACDFLMRCCWSLDLAQCLGRGIGGRVINAVQLATGILPQQGGKASL